MYVKNKPMNYSGLEAVSQGEKAAERNTTESIYEFMESYGNQQFDLMYYSCRRLSW